MIKKLTKEQIFKISDYVERGLQMGLSIQEVSDELIRNSVNEICTKILQRPELLIVIVDNPYIAHIAVCMTSQGKDIPLTADTEWFLKNKPKKLFSFVWPYIDGHFFSAFFAFYDYMEEVLKIKLKDTYAIFKNILNFELLYPLEKINIVSRKPIEINMLNGRLHADGKPALKYKGDFCLWSLNGIIVSQEIAETPASKLSPKLVLSEKNVQVRSEILKKIGAEKVIKELDSILIEQSSDGVYFLYSVPLDSDVTAMYLKMKNPSTGEWHFECVEGNTIKEALAWRDEDPDGIYIKPDVLT